MKASLLITAARNEIPALTAGASILITNGLLSGTAERWTTALLAVAGTLLTIGVHQGAKASAAIEATINEVAPRPTPHVPEHAADQTPPSTK